MFKVGSGRKCESTVWKFFKYEKSCDKSTCLVAIKTEANGNPIQCGEEIKGKFTTNLKNHLRFKHKQLFDEFNKEEEQKKNNSHPNEVRCAGVMSKY